MRLSPAAAPELSPCWGPQSALGELWGRAPWPSLGFLSAGKTPLQLKYSGSHPAPGESREQLGVRALFSWVNWVKGADGGRLLDGPWHLFWEQGFGCPASGHGGRVTAWRSWSEGQAWGQARPENCPGTDSPQSPRPSGTSLSTPFPHLSGGSDNTVLPLAGILKTKGA